MAAGAGRGAMHGSGQPEASAHGGRGRAENWFCAIADGGPVSASTSASNGSGDPGYRVVGGVRRGRCRRLTVLGARGHIPGSFFGCFLTLRLHPRCCWGDGRCLTGCFAWGSSFTNTRLQNELSARLRPPCVEAPMDAVKESDTVPIFSGQSPRQLCNLPFEPGKVALPSALSGDSVVRPRDPEMLTGAKTDDLPAAIC
jgi:hypothetical protein